MNAKIKGLSGARAKKLLEQFGPNEIIDLGRISIVRILLRQIKNNFIVYLLIVATAISFAVDKDITAYTILAVIVIVILTGFIQEYKAEKAIEYLKKMVMPVTLAVRDGEETEIPSREIVPGDVIIVRMGEKVPADCVIIEASELAADESILTGESREVYKTPAPDPDNYGDGNALFAGSFIVGGKGLARAVHTGMNTKFGQIAGMISATEKTLPLQAKVNKIVKFMAIIGASMAILTGLGVLFTSPINEELVIDVLILIIAISVSAFPEGFPVVLITTLSVGAFRMAKKDAIVNRMSIIETLGETTVICTDKTGTITKGEMTVKKIFCDHKTYDLGGVGYEAKGDFVRENRIIDPEKEKVLALFLKTAVLCNDAVIKPGEIENAYKTSGLPTEAALLVMAAKAKIFREDFFHDRDEELTFSSERKMMSVLIRDGKNTAVYAKGAPEVILDKCDRIRKSTGVAKITAKDRARIIAEAKKMAQATYRTIALAYKEGECSGKDCLESDLVFLGIAAIEDPPREEVKEALLTCKRAGIAVKMITGDNLSTALSIAEQIGLEKGRAMEGGELDQVTDEELIKIVNEISVFARVRPEHKLRIVRALKENGEIVTMTGDGVNDSPALKEAHIGVAMGINGTDVSRSVADLILKNDNFATIVDAVREGRTIFNNIRKFATYQLSCNYAELTIIFVGVLLSPFLGWPVPVLLAIHILFMNLITDNLPAITLGFNHSSPDIMEDGPRKGSGIFTKDMIIALALSGFIMALFTLGAFYFTYSVLGQSVSDARTTSLVVLILLEIAGAFNFRSFRKNVLGRSPLANRYLVYASLASLFATAMVIYTPLNKGFETTPIPFWDWLVAAAFALAMVVIFDILKKINNKKQYLRFE